MNDEMERLIRAEEKCAMNRALRLLLIQWAKIGGAIGGYPVSAREYVLILWDGRGESKRFWLSHRDYMGAFRIWQWCQHPARRKPYTRGRAA